MPTLVLVRHAQASHSYPDRSRPLTEAGRDQAARLGEALAREIGTFSVAVSSDARRARQTFAAIMARVDVADAWRECGLYYADEEDVIELARSFSGDAGLIVGHEPTISSAGYLLAREEDRESVARGVGTATALVLGFCGAFEGLAPGSCSLRVLEIPPTR